MLSLSSRKRLLAAGTGSRALCSLQLSRLPLSRWTQAGLMAQGLEVASAQAGAACSSLGSGWATAACWSRGGGSSWFRGAKAGGVCLQSRLPDKIPRTSAIVAGWTHRKRGDCWKCCLNLIFVWKKKKQTNNSRKLTLCFAGLHPKMGAPGKRIAAECTRLSRGSREVL